MADMEGMEPAMTAHDARLSRVELRDRKWSRGRELNPRPIDYESIALPLSYPGVSRAGREKRDRV